MECQDGDSVKQKIISNLLSSGVEKFFIMGIQFISSIILIRLLPREDYGIIGVVAGYFVFVAFINISFESIILRDHKKYDDNLKNIIQTFLMANLLKAILFIIVAIVLTYILPRIYENSEFIYAIWAITFIMIADSITAPFTIYFASKFNQKLVTKVSILRYLISFLLLFGLFQYPELWYIALKDLIVSCIFIFIWFVLANKKLNFKPRITKIDVSFLLNTFFSYSLWTHLNGIITNFIYRSDTFFLSFFVSLLVVGNYSVALNSANIANVIPGIISYQNSIALSHTKLDKDKSIEITKNFLKLSSLLGMITLMAFYFLGQYYIYILTGSFNDEIYFILNYIVTGLIIVKVFASPLSSYLCIIDDVKKYFFKVILTTFIFTIVVYALSAAYFGAKGIAVGNIFVSLIFLVFLLIHFKKRLNVV